MTLHRNKIIILFVFFHLSFVINYLTPLRLRKYQFKCCFFVWNGANRDTPQMLAHDLPG